jgi:D-serine deaminase-like pyridoxal phosphate-dependent protein
MYPNNTTGKALEEIDTPALLVDLDAFEYNIQLMANFIDGQPCGLRPHVKTHRTSEIALRQIQAGALGIACSKVGEADVMANAGIDDILIANQVVGNLKIQRLIGIAQRAKITVAVDNIENANQLSSAAVSGRVKINALVEVDVGLGRCGVLPGEPAYHLAQAIADLSGLNFSGLMGYEGHAVMVRDFTERKKIAEDAMKRLMHTKALIELRGIPVHIVSAGGTGTYKITGTYPGVTEVQPGSYVLMDTAYKTIVPEFKYALTVLSTIVSRPRDRIAILDIGLKTVSTDMGTLSVTSREDVKMLEPSEEHWNIDIGEGPDLKPGDRIQIIPGHVCTTINLHDRLYGVREDRVESLWPIDARGQSR